MHRNRRGGGGARPERRPFRRSNPREIPPELQRANALMDAENYPEAADALSEIAKAAERRRGPRAPMFYLRAGGAYALAKVPNKASEHFKKGLSMIAARRDWAPLDEFGQRAVNELKEAGFETAAEELAAYILTLLPQNARKKTEINLPTQCPTCGAPIPSDEVEWIDEKTAVCMYCGNPTRGEA